MCFVSPQSNFILHLTVRQTLTVCVSVCLWVRKLFYFTEFLKIRSNVLFQSLQDDRAQQADKNKSLK